MTPTKIRALPFALLVALCAPRAHAQEGTDAAAARALFGEGRKLAAEGNYADACPKFEESLRLDHGIGTEFNLADCWAHVQRDASAWALFLNVAAEAKATGQNVREDLARARAQVLEPRLARLVIRVAAPSAGLELRRDTALVGQASWGVPVPVDPGAHVIDVTAPGHKKWSRTVQLDTPGTITLEVPPLEVDPNASSAVATAATPAAVPAVAATSGSATSSAPPPGTSDQPTIHSNGHRTAAWVVGGIGVAALGVGTVFALQTKSKNDSAKGICPSNEHCTQAEADQHVSLLNSAKSARTASFIGFGVGGAAVVTAAVLLLTAKPAASETSSSGFRALPVLGQNAFGGVLEGAW